MKNSDWLTALTAFLAALLFVPVPAIATPQLVDVCHHTADATPDEREWRLIRVNERSVPHHLDHGDVLPGEQISGTDRHLDPNCDVREEAPAPPEPSEPEPTEPAPSSELIFAVAYSDIDPSDGAYNPEVDVLIAKLIDGPDDANDGLPGVGDLIVTHLYPEDFGPTDLGSFGVVEHTVTAFNTGESYVCSVSAESANFVWSSGQGNFHQYMEWSSAEALTNLYDDRSWSTAEQDEILTRQISPSAPSNDLALSGSDPSDQAFVDVEADCSLT